VCATCCADRRSAEASTMRARSTCYAVIVRQRTDRRGHGAAK
jgi:hypothetical protein